MLHRFWYEKSPADVASWIKDVSRTRTGKLGTQAVTKCPPTLAEAERLP